MYTDEHEIFKKKIRSLNVGINIVIYYELNIGSNFNFKLCKYLFIFFFVKRRRMRETLSSDTFEKSSVAATAAHGIDVIKRIVGDDETVEDGSWRKEMGVGNP